METNTRLSHILCLSCPASADYSSFFEKLLVDAYHRSKDGCGEEKKEGNMPYHFDTFVCNNDTLRISTSTRSTFNQKVNQATTIIVTGSSSSAYDDDLWIKCLSKTIVEANNRGVQLLGICFGHQIIAQSLGGKVIKNPNGVENGVCTYVVTDYAMDYLSALSKCSGRLPSNKLSLYCWHGDVVSILPPKDFVPGGFNENTQHQMYYNKSNVLCFQSHPEFNSEWLMSLAKKYYFTKDIDRYHLIEASVNELEESVLVASTFINDAIYQFCIVNGIHGISTTKRPNELKQLDNEL